MKKTRLYYIVVFIIIFLAGMYAGIVFYRNGIVPSSVKMENGVNIDRTDGKKKLSFSQFWDTWDFIKKNYISDNVNDSDLFYGALDGLLGALNDPYSTYFDPKESKEFNDALNGDFEGIGAYVDKKNGKVLIVSPLPGSPAEKAGIKPMDQIISVNDELVDRMSLDQVVTKIRGPKDTFVNLNLYREGSEELLKLEVQRKSIHIPSVTLEYNDNIAVVRIYSFNSDLTKMLTDTMNDIVKARPRGVIIDLRGNPGGFLDQVVNVVGFWSGSKPVVIERGRNNYEKIHLSEFDVKINNLKTVVLIDGGSASAAEIFAGALQDYKLGTIIGVTSFGKGSVQRLEEYPDGSSFKITIAKWYTPNNNAIDGVGIKPDIEVPFDVKLFAEKHVDTQMQKALEFLKEN